MNRFLFAILVSVFTTSIFAKVTVQFEDKQFVYESAPRLDEVLAPVAFQKEWYWPAARLFSLHDSGIADQKVTLLEQLELMQTEFREDSVLLSDLGSLKNQLLSWKLEKFIIRTIDFDQARLIPKHNPRLPEGDYLLQLSQRSSSLLLLGLISEPAELPYPDNFCLADQLGSMKLLPSASMDWAFVIQPNGSIDKIGIAYWNRDCRSVMPGSIVYIPFKEGIFSSQFAELNRRVSEILVNKVAVL